MKRLLPSFGCFSSPSEFRVRFLYGSHGVFSYSSIYNAFLRYFRGSWRLCISQAQLNALLSEFSRPSISPYITADFVDYEFFEPLKPILVVRSRAVSSRSSSFPVISFRPPSRADEVAVKTA